MASMGSGNYRAGNLNFSNLGQTHSFATFFKMSKAIQQIAIALTISAISANALILWNFNARLTRIETQLTHLLSK